MTGWRNLYHTGIADRIGLRDGRLERVTDPAPAVPLADARAYLRVDGTLEDDIVAGAVLSAQGLLEPPHGWLGRALTTAEYEFAFSCFAYEIDIPAPPFGALISFTYLDRQGVEQEVDPELYRITGTDQATISLKRHKHWPTDLDATQPDAIKVRYTAGYGSAEDVPKVIRQWMLYQIAQFYDIRQNMMVGTIVQATPFVRDMLESWRIRD